MFYRLCFLLLGALAGISSAWSEVDRVEIDSRQPVLEGRSFGAYGSYEFVRGRLYLLFGPAERALYFDCVLRGWRSCVRSRSTESQIGVSHGPPARL